MSDTAIVIVAAGSGTRLGRGVPKAFALVGGVPVLEHALNRLASVDARAVLVVPAGFEEEAKGIAARVGIDAAVVRGGATRAASVAAGLAHIGGARFVLVHDAARALAPVALVERVRDALRVGAGAVVPVLPVADTIRTVHDADAGPANRSGSDRLGGVVDRASLRSMQTPQGFDAALLERAYAEAGSARDAATDDAQLVQALGVDVVAVPGDEAAFKITTEADAMRAERMLEPAETRVGVGVDVHAFGGEGPLRVAGLTWDGQGLAGHSDGDVVCHAIVDALLGAAGLGDIGELVGVDDPRFAGAAGEVFVRRAVEALAVAGWRPQNVSVQVLGVRPRIGARREEAQVALSAMVGAPVSVSGTTTDGLGAIGRGEGVQAIATALIRRA